MNSEPTRFLCLLTGSSLPEYYVDRLYRMLAKHTPGPFTLTCMTERERPFQEKVEQLDISGWKVHRPDMRPTQQRLRYFASETCPLDEFVSIDVTLVIKSSLAPMLDFANSRPEPLVIVDDWNRPTVNGSVMRVRRSDALRAIYDDYANGVRYPVDLIGDQDYIDAVIQAHKLNEHVAFFPEEQMVSFKKLRQIMHKDPAKAKAMLDKACILKFHGKPRPHELFDPKYHWQHALRHPKTALKDSKFLVKETDEWWRQI